MDEKRVIRDCIVLFALFSIIAMANLNGKFFIIPDQEKMIDTQSNLFTICSVFAGFSFSILGLVLGVFSEKIIEKLKGTTLIQRKCHCIVRSIIYFCASGFISLMFMLGINIYLAEITDKASLIDNVLYINGIGFLLFGMIYFMVAVKNLLAIIGKIYGFNNKAFTDKKERYYADRKKLARKRKEQEGEEDND